MSVVDDREDFLAQRLENINKMSMDNSLQNSSRSWFDEASVHNYSYNFDWLGLPIIQFPQDMVAIQEIIWSTKPDVIIETGVARGGSLILSASILHLLNGNGKVLGVDIDIRPHNREAIETHSLSNRIELIQGSSTEDKVFNEVNSYINKSDRVMVILDSNHTHEHVMKELDLYSNLVSKGCYLVVMDTVVNDMPKGFFDDRPWDQNNNPKTAVYEFLSQNDNFEIDENIHNKLLITVAPSGYLKCIK